MIPANRSVLRHGLRLLALVLLAPALPAVAGTDEIDVVTLPAPPFPAAASGVPENALRQVSARPNAITDTEAWFERTGVRLPIYELPDAEGVTPGNLPAGIQMERRGLRLIKALRGAEATLLVYGPDWSGGRLLVGMDPGSGRVLYAFDFASYEETPGWKSEFSAARLLWAVQEGRTLYVAHAHSTYAKETGGKNGYLTAIDLDRRELRWRSPALVANASTFVLHGDLLLTGYGFTAEPDFVYLLDKKTGEVKGRQKVKSGPEVLAVHDGKLHVRCYDTDYVFELPAAPRIPTRRSSAPPTCSGPPGTECALTPTFSG
jgi:outer membrane protein assembly factor BamB